MKPESLLVVDIETIPDAAHHEGSGFPIRPFHQVIAIGFLEAGIGRGEHGETYRLGDLRCGGEADYDEAKLLQAFFIYFERSKPRLITYNGRTFDLPVLKYRAMLHGIRTPWLYRAGDRYSNYGYRYSSEWHYDLMDILSDFGASPAPKLDEIARLCGFPGKLGIDGSQVKSVYDAGGIEDIRSYCETDVLNTYLVYLRHRLHTANITKDVYNRSVSDVIEFLHARKDNRPHLGEFLKAWEACSRGRFLLE